MWSYVEGEVVLCKMAQKNEMSENVLRYNFEWMNI